MLYCWDESKEEGIMTPTLLATILVRTIALYLFAQGAGLFPMMFRRGSFSPGFFLLAPEFALMGVAVLVWVFATRIATAMVGETETTSSEQPLNLSREVITVLVVSIIGVTALVVAVPQLVGSVTGLIIVVTRWASKAPDAATIDHLRMSSISWVVRGAVQVVVALVVLACRNRIAQLIIR
jgi:hypothetical protein